MTPEKQVGIARRYVQALGRFWWLGLVSLLRGRMMGGTALLLLGPLLASWSARPGGADRGSRKSPWL
ncbi:MAG: hypothetical protein IPL39_09210 [Opitutaceae bacterium]|nr:hypothetical protein [Opitutaceae bacterium]